MLEIIDQLNDFVLTDNFVLVSFDAVNMFPSIDNRSVLESAKNILIANEFDMDSTQCIVEALEMCLTCNNSKFNDRNFLQTDVTGQGPHMSCSYAKYDFLANQFHLKPKIWKRFIDDIFTLWEHGVDTLPSFLDYLNGMDTTGKIGFTMEIASENGLEFLDLKLKIAEGKIRVDVYAKPTNSFSYTSPNTCYPKNNICNIPKGIASRLRRICDDDETCDKRSTEHQNYLIAREHKPSLVKQQFSEVRKKTRAEAWQKQNRKGKVSDVKFITTYDPALPNIKKIIKNNLAILCTDKKMKKIFPPNTIKTLYWRKKNLKEILSPSLFLSKAKQMKILLPVVVNVTFVRIFLYLTLNSNVKLQIEYIISDVNLLVTPLMLFI